MNSQLLERGKYLPALIPIDTTGAGADGDWVSMKNWRRLVIGILQGAWAGGTPAVTLEQAADAAGTGAKALTLENRYQHVAFTSDTLVKTAVTSNTFNLPATANTFTLMEIHQQDLDVNNGFCFVRVRVATPGANADLIAAFYHLGDPVFEGKPEYAPTAIA